MKVIAFLFSFFLITQAYAHDHLDLVIDLDQTLIDLAAAQDHERTQIQSCDFYWDVTPGAKEFIQALSKLPKARISFFSAGFEVRNLEILKNIYLPDGPTAFDVAQGRVFSRQSLHFDAASGLFKKDIRVVSQDIDLDSAILIDNEFAYAFNGQERNLLWLPDEKLEETSFSQALQDLKPNPNDKEKLMVSTRNHRLIRAMGLITKVLELSEKLDISPVDALVQIQWQDQKVGKESFDLSTFLDQENYVIGFFTLSGQNRYFFAPLRIPVSKTKKALFDAILSKLVLGV